jgi:iron(III) transport system substrate-binding protein
MKKSPWRLSAFLLTLLVLLNLTGASMAAAEELLVYTALEDDEIPIYLDLFKKAHPDIEVKIVRDSTGIVTAKLLAEKDNPRADVVWGTAATSLMLCDQAGMVAPYAPKGWKKSARKCATPTTRPTGSASRPG